MAIIAAMVDNQSKDHLADKPPRWAESDVDGLVFRLLQSAYRSDKKSAHFLIDHLRNALLRELT